jgi:hypothetical protein
MNDSRDRTSPYWWQTVAPSVDAGGWLGILARPNRGSGILGQFDPPDQTWDRSTASRADSAMPFGRAGGIPGLPAQPIDQPWFNPAPEKSGPAAWNAASATGVDWLALARKAAEPITSYPGTYSQMNREAQEQVAHGIEQIKGAYEPGVRDPIGFVKGLGNVGLGTVGYVASPISAALRTIAGKPLEETVGIPKEYTEFALSLGIPGFGLRSAFPTRPTVPNSLASKSAQLYDPPVKPPRPFSADYPHGAPADATGRLLADIEGRPLVAERIVGRRTLGGGDEALTPAQLEPVAAAGIGRHPESVAAREIRGNAGNFAVRFDAAGNPIYEILIDRGLIPAQKDRVLAHELGHALDYFAGHARGIPQEGIKTELRGVYNTGVTGQERTRNLTGPQHQGYAGEKMDRELMAEAIRAYMTDPNYFKTVAPNAAAAIRAAVNSHPQLSRLIQFNNLGGLAPAGAAIGAAMGTAPDDALDQ